MNKDRSKQLAEVEVQLFHGSCFHFKPGFMLLPQSDGYVQGDDVCDFEVLVDSRRPMQKLSRSQSVFLSSDMSLIDSAGGYIDAIYRVAVNTPRESSDLAWYSAAWCEFSMRPFDHSKVIDLIDRYWSGELYVDAEASNVEFRTKSAVIIEMCELNVPIDELSLISPQTTPFTN